MPPRTKVEIHLQQIEEQLYQITILEDTLTHMLDMVSTFQVAQDSML